MSSRKDPFWEHVVKIRTDVWKCNFCNEECRGRPIRIKAHLGGISGMGVKICNSPDLPAEVRQQAAEAIKKKKDPIDHGPEETLEERRSEPSNKRQRGSDFVNLPIQGEVPPSDYHALLGSHSQVSIIHHNEHRDLVHGTVYLPARPHLVSLVQLDSTDDDNGGNRLDFSPCPPDEETPDNLWIVKEVQEEISLPSSQLRYSLRKLNIEIPTLNYLFSIAATVYLENLQHLTVDSCWKLEGIVAAGSILPSGAFHELKSISIAWNNKMKTVVGIELVSHLKKLQLIHVSRCYSIEEIIARSPQLNVGATFESLTKLKVFCCPKITTLLKHELLLQLPKLEELDVGSCFGMEEIIGQPSMMITDGGIPLPTLKRLYLHHLPELKHVYDGGLCSNSINTVHIKECQMLKKFPFRMILNDEAQPSPPPYIEEIVISEKELYWWEALEWDHPDTKNILQPYLQLQ